MENQVYTRLSVSWSMATTLSNSVVVLVRMHPQSIVPLAMITMRKLNQRMGFILFPMMSMGLGLAAL